MHAPHQQSLALAGLASMNGSSRKSGNAMLRSGRQRRKAFLKAEDALIVAAWKRWGSPEAMPMEAQAELHEKIAHLRRRFVG